MRTVIRIRRRGDYVYLLDRTVLADPGQLGQNGQLEMEVDYDLQKGGAFAVWAHEQSVFATRYGRDGQTELCQIGLDRNGDYLLDSDRAERIPTLEEEQTAELQDLVRSIFANRGRDSAPFELRRIPDGPIQIPCFREGRTSQSARSDGQQRLVGSQNHGRRGDNYTDTYEFAGGNWIIVTHDGGSRSGPPFLTIMVRPNCTPDSLTEALGVKN